jgi:hypothetical protein
MSIERKLLTRKSASDCLRAWGFEIAGATLAKLACLGGGPRFMRFGRQVLYAPEDLMAWAQSRTTAHGSTSDTGQAVPALALPDAGVVAAGGETR